METLYLAVKLMNNQNDNRKTKTLNVDNLVSNVDNKSPLN